LLIAPYSKDRLFDEYLEGFLRSVKARMRLNSDDVVFMCVGTTGTGKTSLMFHALSLYSESPSLSSVALTRKDFAQALFRLTSAVDEPFVGYDEGNVSRREALTQWNRDVIDLYLAIRGKRAFHWWNNPSLDYIDRVFLEERVKFVVFCFSKGAHVRKYRLFTKDNLLRMLDREGDLRLYTLRKHGHKYAAYEGWFKAYSGPLWGDYLGKKEDRMDEKLLDFNAKYGLEDVQSVLQAASRLGVSDKLLKRALVWAADAGKISKGVDYTVKGSRWLLTGSGVDKMRDLVAEKPYSKRYKGTGVEMSTKGAPSYISREERGARRAGGVE
jgi:hypothetical protein